MNSTQRARIRFAGILFAGAVALIGIGTGCGDDETTKPPNVLAPPTDLVAVNGDTEITLTWDPSPDEPTKAAAAVKYNIYSYTSSIIGVDPSQLENYKQGSVNAGTTTWTGTVQNGTLYYFHVRAEDEDGKLSNPTNEEAAAGRAEGTGKIIVEFVATGDSGFDFSTGETVSLLDSNPSRFTLTDIYLGTTDNEDDQAFDLALKSPHLLANRNANWSGRIAGIKYLGTSWAVSQTATDGFVDQLTFGQGAVFAIKTPGATPNYAKIRITAIAGTAGSRQITFDYAYQQTPGLVEF